MEKNKRVPNHKIVYDNQSLGEKKTTKFRFDSSNGFVFVTALVIIAIVIVLVTAMVGFNFSAK